MAFRPPCLWAQYKKAKHFIQERTQKKQTSKQINKQKKKEVKMKTAKSTPTQHCPEKPTLSQTSPPSPLSAAFHLHLTHSSSHHLPIILHSPLTNTCTRASTDASMQSAAQPLTHQPLLWVFLLRSSWQRSRWCQAGSFHCA